jgi:hypothetical protein
MSLSLLLAEIQKIAGNSILLSYTNCKAVCVLPTPGIPQRAYDRGVPSRALAEISVEFIWRNTSTRPLKQSFLGYGMIWQMPSGESESVCVLCTLVLWSIESKDCLIWLTSSVVRETDDLIVWRSVCVVERLCSTRPIPWLTRLFEASIAGSPWFGCFSEPWISTIPAESRTCAPANFASPLLEVSSSLTVSSPWCLHVFVSHWINVE